MAQSLEIIARNANGVLQHMNEVIISILNNNIDIMLISETHLTRKHYFKIPSYSIYHITHPNSTAYSDTVIIIKNNI